MITFCRYYHMSCTLYSFKKQGIKLSKMINPKGKRQWYPAQMDSAQMPSLKSLTKVKNEPDKRGIRRIAMLNKMFMKQITDIMSTGTVSMDILGRGIEISKVNVSADFQTVNVFWVCKGNASDKETEMVLNKAAGALRHELSTLRVMGEVPYIVFVKDKQEARLVDLDRCLAMADYGEDYKPTDLGHLLKSEFTLETKLSPEMKAKIRQVEEELPIVEEPLPEMTHNVYGLDHAKIMNRLLAARKKSRDAWKNLGSDDVITYKAGQEVKPTEDTGNQSKELAEFLLKRQILQNKLSKQLRKSNDDWLALNNEKDDEDDLNYDGDFEDEYVYEEDDFYQENSQYHVDNNKNLMP